MDRIDNNNNNKTTSNPNSATMSLAQGNYKHLKLDSFRATSQSFMTDHDSEACYGVNYNYTRVRKLCYIPTETRSRYQ